MKYVASVLGIVLLALGIAAFVPQASIAGNSSGMVPVLAMRDVIFVQSASWDRWRRRVRGAAPPCGGQRSCDLGI
jgi:signal peptidase I